MSHKEEARFNKHAFRKDLERFSRQCWGFAQSLVSDTLPPSLRFFIAPQSISPDEHLKYLGGRLVPRAQLQQMQASDVVQLLWIDGSIPLWINLGVHGATPQQTFIELTHSWELTTDPEQLYYRKQGNGPFHVQSPPLPPGWTPGAGKFPLKQR